MTRRSIPESRYRTLLDVIGAAHAAADLDEFRRGVLPGVRRLVPADFSSYNEIPAGDGAHVAIVDPELPGWAYVAWEEHAHTNPIVARFAQFRDGRPYRFSDLVTQDELHRLPVYQEIYRPLGVEYQLAFALPSPPQLTIGIALSRRERDFSDVDRDLLALLRPHLIQAYRNAQLRRGADRIAELSPAALEALGLTPAEARVLAAFARGLSTHAAAAELGVSPRTVLKHGERIHRKLGVHDRAQAVATAWAATSAAGV